MNGYIVLNIIAGLENCSSRPEKKKSFCSQRLQKLFWKTNRKNFICCNKSAALVEKQKI